MSNKLNTGAPVQIGTAVTGTVAASVAAVDISSIGGDGSAKYALIQIAKASSAGAGATTLPGPVKVVGTCQGRRMILAQLNGGSSIAVDENGGYQELVQGVLLCTALVLIPAGALTGTTPAYDAWAIPVEGAP